MIEDIAANLIWRTAIKEMIICLFKVYYMWFPTLIIFKMDDDGSALRVGAKYKSFTDLECARRPF
jgi:hypothetical protein